MGNTDSQSSVVSPAKPSCSLRFSSRRQEAPSARSWWRSSQGGSRSRSRSSSWHHEHAPIGSWRLRTASPQRDSRGGCRRPFGYPERAGGSDGVCGSPKVLLSKNGSMRVEFTNRVVPIESQGFTGLPATVAPQAEPSLHTSKCSSLSSSGSWYDSPWGAAADLADNVFVRGPSGDNSSGCTTHSSSRTKETQTSTSSYSNFLSAQVDDVSPGPNSVLLLPSTTVYNTCSSSRTEDSGIGDSVILHPDLGDFGLLSSHAASRDSVYTLPAFPTAPDSGTAAAACASSALLDDVIQEEGGAGRGGVQLYSSHTLPCRRTEPVGSTLIIGNNRKDFLKSRIRRLSDWTGSLSRKKRRIQEPRGSDSGDVFTGGLSSGPVVSSTVWSSNPLHTLNQLPPVQRGSSLGLNRSGDDQQQNIYDNFLQELETGFSGPADRTEPSAGNGETLEDEIDGEVELGGGEHLDSLLEKEHSVVRRAGWLSFKPLIGVSKDGKLELAVRRKWKHYWVTLKGCTLLFHETYAKSSAGEQGLCPSYTLLAEDSIMQAVPEHPKREHVFCLSNMYGDVYLFQAANQTDLENWVTAVHSASASRLARREGKEDTLHLLRRQSRSLVHKIDVDGKMKKMAELQLSVIKEPKNRKAVESQIQQWEQNLERLNLDLFRLRCYLSSLQGSELPNPKSLLAVASRPSKSTLGRLGVFSVSSFHALVCSRDGEMLQRRRWSLSGGNNRKRGLPSSLKSLHRRSGDTAIQRLHNSPQHIVVAPPTGRPAAAQVCDEPRASVHGIFSLHVSRPHAAPGLGFQVTGHVDGVGKSHIFVSEVDPLGLSAGEGLRAGDEVLAVNGSPVSGLDLDLMQTLFTHQKLQLLLRRDESPDPEEEPHAVWPDPGQAADPCDPPASPNLHTSTADVLSPDTVPPPAFDDVIMRLCEEGEMGQDMDRVHSLYQNVPDNPYSREVALQVAGPTHSSVYQRLRKVIQELVDTERSYVKDLVCLFDLYLTPLQKETFLTKEEMEALFGSLPEMLDFQRVFLQTLEEKIKFCPNLSHLETPEQFKKLLFSLGGSFLYYADHFKLYSGFCANHIKVQKVLERAKTDGAFRHFLETRNPTNQHSACLESYLIKPVQRVLKYPLLLRELVSLTVPESPEHTHLTEALGAMEKVASHINEMQKIYEDYGCVFDQLAAEQNGADKQVTEISMGEFLAHSSVVWLNPLPGLGRLRKEPELTVFVFKQAVVLVYRENSKLKRRMMGTRSADLDPFRFRWLIPVSALQVRPANITGSEDTCVWELVHSRSELEGRPETVFQLCSRDLEMMSRVLRVLRSLLRDRVSAGSLTRTKRSSSWQRSRCSDARRTTRRRAESCRPEGRFTQGETCSEPLLLSLSLSERVGRRSRLCSLTSELEAQLQSLHFSEEEAAAREAAAVEVRWSSGLRQGGPADISSLLDRDFSAQSFSSIINEECFYDSSFGIPKAVLPTLQG